MTNTAKIFKLHTNDPFIFIKYTIKEWLSFILSYFTNIAIYPAWNVVALDDNYNDNHDDTVIY